jgi:hypothetical protein
MYRRFAAFAGLLTVTLMAACAPPNTGITGNIDTGPACTPGGKVDCPKVEPVTVLISNERGDPVANVTANDQGHFIVALRSGTYIVQARRGSSQAPKDTSKPVIVQVNTGNFTLVRLTLSGAAR